MGHMFGGGGGGVSDFCVTKNFYHLTQTIDVSPTLGHVHD